MYVAQVAWNPPMSQQLTLEISDEVYADLQRKASAVGISITEWVVTVLTRQDVVANRVGLSLEQQERARQKFKSHAGAIGLGYSTDTDNESIDADLAKAYADEY